MKAKLIKEEEGYYVYVNTETIGTTRPLLNFDLVKYKLSLKNCQAIERGYDLDDLAENYGIENGLDLGCFDEVKNSKTDFKAGFQKALELNNTKLYTLEDMMNCWNKALTFQTHKETLGEHIQSLQQTEWDVEIEMICPHPKDTYVCGIQYGCDEDGCNHPNQVPYLDEDGCLILKKL